MKGGSSKKQRFQGVVRSSGRASQERSSSGRKGPNRRQLSNLAEYGQVDGLGGDDGGELDADERRLVKRIDDTKAAAPQRPQQARGKHGRPVAAVAQQPTAQSQTATVAEEEDDGAAWEKPSAMEQLLKMLGTSSSAAAAAPAKAKRSHNKEDEEDEEQDEEQEEEEETQRKRPAKKQRKTGELDKVDESVAEDDDDDESTEVDDGNEGDDKEEEEEEEEQTDYFDVHFSDDATEEVQTSAELQASEGFKWHSQQYTSAVLGNVTVMETFEPDGDEGSDLGASEISPMADNLTTFSIKNRLHPAWQRLNTANVELSAAARGVSFTPLQASLMSYLSEYKDVYYSQCGASTDAEINNAIALHAINHAIKTRDRVLKNTAKINQQEKSSAGDTVLDVRDQGFTRPKVLIVLPFRHQALQVMNSIMALAPVADTNASSFTIENRKRFLDEYDISEDEKLDREEDEAELKAAIAAGNTEAQSQKKPADYLRIFDGNIDDCFRIGLKITRKSFKLYSDFYSSDILLASPLGLRLIIGAEGDKKRDFDFLSSIEVAVVGFAHVLGMQNWDHLLNVFDCMNLVPKEAHGCDFSRTRQWSLDGQAKFVRQTILLSDYPFPEANALFNRYCANFSGKIKTKAPSEKGTITQVVRQVQHVFNRVPASDLAQSEDARFEYFVSKVFPSIRSSTLSKRTCIFVPTYFEYVRLRNFMRSSEIVFAGISEYTADNNVARSRTRFAHGHRDLLLYSERFHFFRRLKIRGIRHVLFYALPVNAQFYSEILNMLQGSGGDSDLSCTVLFTRFDAIKLERVVGTSRASRMVSSDKPMFMFC